VAAALASVGVPATTAAQDAGISVESELVRTKCGSCHTVDKELRMSRISYRRATPENWERTIKRMVTLNKVDLEPADARAILKYLADHNGLAPVEAKPGANEAERRLVDFPYAADKDTADLCGSCHAVSRVVNERRTKEEWDLLIAMHRGYYPLVDNQPMNGGQGFRRTRTAAPEPAADGRPPDTRHPMDRAVAHLAKTFPLQTPEWAAWSAGMQAPKLAGRWAISGYQPGKGPIYGAMTVTADPKLPDTFVTETRYTIGRTGETVRRTGRALVYTGYQWRGRGASPQPAADENPWREVMTVDREWKQMSGRWFTGGYDETGADVQLVRLGKDPMVLGSSVALLKAGSISQRVKIFGANLPAAVKAEEIAFGAGIRATRVVSTTAEEITLDVDVAADAKTGPRDISLLGLRSSRPPSVRASEGSDPAVLNVYSRIDGIKVTPQAGMARAGGAVFPKQLQQFEAVAVANGPDGKPGTPDDLQLGTVPVKWSLEEYTATFDDDDLQFVGALDQTGLFTPNVDGPNPKRSGERNNIGDVWVVAEFTAEGGAKPLRARAHLLVTVPVYMRWFNAEGTR
jgi:quinohemoprotein amine dehydrogenase